MEHQNARVQPVGDQVVINVPYIIGQSTTSSELIEAPPPSYDTLFGRIERVDEERRIERVDEERRIERVDEESRIERVDEESRIERVIRGELGRIEHIAREDDDDVIESCNDFLKCFIRTFGLIIIGITFLIGIPELVFGIRSIDGCPAQPMIPIYLIVLPFLCFLWMVTRYCVERRRDAVMDDSKVYRVDKIIIVLPVIWFFIGNVWIYRICEPEVDDIYSSNYCDSATYYMAFWTTNITYIFLVMFCCGACYTRCNKGEWRRNILVGLFFHY